MKFDRRFRLVTRHKKLKYEAPTSEVMCIELEQGIAASSATVSGGYDGNPFVPQVEEWESGGIESQNGDL